MGKCIDDYREIVGDELLYEIYTKARRLSNKHILHINSTYQGGGVAEMLNSIILLMNDIGVFTGWRILHGTPDFFSITKKFHNALQGDKMKQRLYIECNENFARFTHIDHDLIIVHDPQPLPLIKFYRKRQPWIWRCHIDITCPNRELWNYIKTFIIRYDMVIVSDEKYKKEDLPVPQCVHYPSIDPLSSKNKPLSEDTIHKYLHKFGVPTDKPIITQISRFDKWKDMEGVIKVFELVKQEVDCRLVICGDMAPDDPEGQQIYYRLIRKTRHIKDLLLVIGDNQIFVNALQNIASVVIQKSLREGFALTVTEALWKGRPVVASNVGGLPLQVIDGKTGFLVEPNDIEGFANRVVKLLKEPELARELGENGRAHVKKNFLVTKSILDYLDIITRII
ncbi:MAG: glycosyltransferase [bacterium]